MIATIDVGSKNNEIIAFASLLDQICCLENVVISADRRRTQRTPATRTGAKRSMSSQRRQPARPVRRARRGLAPDPDWMNFS